MSLFTKKHMRIHHSIHALFLVIVFLSGCSSVTSEPTLLVETATATLIRIPTEQQITSTPTPTFSPTETIEVTISGMTALPSDNILKFRPFEFTPDFPSNINLAGTLVTWGEQLQLLHFYPQVQLEAISGIDFDGCLSTSPDGKWLAYCPLSDDSPTGQWLIIQSADWREQKKVPMDMQLRSFGNYLWLDNQRLIFPRIQDGHRPQAYPMVVINPFTEEQVELDSDYPELQLSVAGPAGRMDFGYSDVVYDPSLNLVIFPSWKEDSYIVLWDRTSNSVLAKVTGAVGYYPLWSPDAKQFAVPLLAREESENIIEEWFLVSQSGQVEQLTHFGDYFTTAEISPTYNWSPDSQKLAFWLDVSPSLCPGLNLAVLDVSTKQVINTCIPGQGDYAPPPVWSLDSRYVAIVNANPTPHQTILVDIEQGQAFDITDITGVSRPVGWLVSP